MLTKFHSTNVFNACVSTVIRYVYNKIFTVFIQVYKVYTIIKQRYIHNTFYLTHVSHFSSVYKMDELLLLNSIVNTMLKFPTSKIYRTVWSSRKRKKNSTHLVYMLLIIKRFTSIVWCSYGLQMPLIKQELIWLNWKRRTNPCSKPNNRNASPRVLRVSLSPSVTSLAKPREAIIYSREGEKKLNLYKYII